MALLENFKNRLIANNRRGSTAYQYVNLVENFLQDQNISEANGVNTDNVAAYTAKLKNEGKDGRAKNFVHAIHAFLKLFQIEDVSTPTTKRYKRKRIVHPFTEDELKIVCNHILNNSDEFGGPVLAFRYAVAICTVCLTGMRAEDFCALKRPQFNNVSHITYLSMKKKKWITVEIPNWLIVLVNQYFDAEQPKNDNSNAFNISRKQLERVLKRAVEEHECLGPGREAFPHILRHSIINILHDKGVSLKDIADMVGHDDIKHTETYLTTNAKSRIDRISPKLKSMKIFNMPKG